MNSFSISPIGIISSCYKEKFGIPRQPGLVKSAPASLVLNEGFSEASVRGLCGFSHIWLTFVFHKTCQKPWKETVRPPRLGGNHKVGVFASRSPFRPNSLGLSVVEIEQVETRGNNIYIHLIGCDLLDKTPVVDIKPYLPYVDCVPQAKGGFAMASPQTPWEVVFSEKARADCQQAEQRLKQEVATVIKQVLALDPRPSYQQGETVGRVYSMKLFDFDLKWQYLENNRIIVLALLV